MQVSLFNYWLQTLNFVIRYDTNSRRFHLWHFVVVDISAFLVLILVWSVAFYLTVAPLGINFLAHLSNVLRSTERSLVLIDARPGPCMVLCVICRWLT